MINKLKNKINSDIHLKELLKGSSIAFVLRIVGIIAGYIFTLLITRGYGAETMGVFALSFTLLQISSVIGRLGMDTALLRFVAEYSSQGKWEIVKDIYKKAIKLVLPFSIIISILVFFSSPYIAELIFKKPNLEPYFKIVSIGIVPFVLLFIHTESLRGLKKIKEYMFLQQAGIFILASILLGIGTLLLTSHVLNIINVELNFLNQVPVLTYIFSVFIISLVAYFVWKNQLNIAPNFRKTYKPLTYSYILSVSVPMLFSSSLALIMGWTDTIMLGVFRTEEEVGIYNVALRVSMITSLSLMAINTIAAPKFAEFYANRNLNELLSFAKKITRIMTMISFPITLLTVLFSKEILYIFGQEFKYGQISLIILTLSQFINVYFGSVIPILNMTGNQVFVQNIILVGSLLNIILNLLFVPYLGIIGAAISTFISILFWNVISGYKVSKFLGKWIIFIPKL